MSKLQFLAFWVNKTFLKRHFSHSKREKVLYHITVFICVLQVSLFLIYLGNLVRVVVEKNLLSAFHPNLLTISISHILYHCMPLYRWKCGTILSTAWCSSTVDSIWDPKGRLGSVWNGLAVNQMTHGISAFRTQLVGMAVGNILGVAF